MRFFAFVLLTAASCVEALALTGAALRPTVASRTSSVAMQFGKQKKKTIPTLEERGYWAGEGSLFCGCKAGGGIQRADGFIGSCTQGVVVGWPPSQRALPVCTRSGG